MGGRVQVEGPPVNPVLNSGQPSDQVCRASEEVYRVPSRVSLPASSRYTDATKTEKQICPA
jgi:hypothetical protein